MCTRAELVHALTNSTIILYPCSIIACNTSSLLPASISETSQLNSYMKTAVKTFTLVQAGLLGNAAENTEAVLEALCRACIYT